MGFKNVLSFLLLLMTILVLVACGGTDESSTEEESDTEESDETTETESETETDESIESGGDLEFATNAQPPTIDPVMSTATATRDVARHIFETLITLDSDYQPVPMLAESWDESDDGLSYTFNLREGILFHNGEEMKADDVVASMDRWLERSATAQTLLSDAKFEEIDEYTVELNIVEPSALIIPVLGGTLQFPAIMPKETIDSATEEGIQEFIGTAPFEFVEWKQDQYIHLAKYDDYQPVDFPADGLSGEKVAHFDNVYIHMVPDPSTRLTGMQTDQYDIGYAFDYNMSDEVEAIPDVEAQIPFIGQYGIVFNKFEGLFADVTMRQAIAAALDLEEIADAGLNGHYRMSPSFMQEEQKDWVSENGSDLYNNPDADEVKRLLDEAGYDDEPVRLITSRDYAYMYNSAVVIQEQLAKHDINLELEVYDWATVTNKRDDPSEWELFITGFPVTVTPVEQLFYNDTWVDGPYDDKTGDLLKEIIVAETQEESSAAWDELQGYSWEFLPILKISDYTTIIGVHDTVENFGFMDGPILWNAHFVN